MKPDKEIEAEIVEEIPLDLRTAGVPKAPAQSTSIQGRVTDRMLIKSEEDKITLLEAKIERLKNNIAETKEQIKLCRKRIKLYEQAEAMRVSVTVKKEAQ